MQQLGIVDNTAKPTSPLLQTLVDNRTTLVNVAARIIGCHSRAEDVVQDAFLRLSKLQEITLPLAAQVGYVFKIVRNLAIDHYRKQAMEQKYIGNEEEGFNVAVDGDTPESTNLNWEIIETIDAALSQLPDRTRYAFEMYRLHGVQQKDIARELGVSPTLVNFMIRDALIHCRKTIDDERT
ncbi:RNA polymerase factor sigma-70 [Azomonas macrocytogenes]|uniref:RNA polymerase sigma-70 factor (ECF subfamily) n=1 Tax=Azomonas macrocytogenes TaxID=69962 RepID=A0A839T643_AZOMA|nr:RNA polymerase factor sigma-70 [Azomonas macrocytogenes]MBB3104568.1 RNA polymerase sigma-70 factor (ECF subfamily) [Azomonas macrocytogenes]